MNIKQLKTWFTEWELPHLISKSFGVVSTVVSSHLVVLTASPDYAKFWASWSMTAPTIIDKAAFEEKLAGVLSACWLIADHFIWKFIENQKVTGSPTIQVEKSAPPLSPQNLQSNAQRESDPKGEIK